MKELIEIGKKAKEASKQLAHLNTNQKNRVLQMVADLLESSAPVILEANALDLKQGEEMGLKGAIVERLTLSEERIKGIADGLREVVQLVQQRGLQSCDRIRHRQAPFCTPRRTRGGRGRS